MPPVLSETQLAHAAAAGDGHAFSQLYEAYESKVFNFCLRICGSAEDAADATQDAFVKVLQRLPKLQGSELNFGAYLFTAARNASYDVIGRRKKADSVDEIPEFGATPFMADERAAAIQEPEKAAMVGALQASVQAANAQLPERQREVLALRELEELSYDEIAEIMGMNRNSVAQLISRARISLRDQLQGDALASIAAKSPQCEKALPLIAMRQDGQLAKGDDSAWLATHLQDCDTCKVSLEAMTEAGVSYRAWAPIVPMAWLWKESMAKAARATGSDWRELIERGRQKQTRANGGAGGRGAGRGLSLKKLGLAFTGAILAGLVVTAIVIGFDDPPPDPAVAAVDQALTTPLPVSGDEPKKSPKKQKDEPPQATTITKPTTSTPVVTTNPSTGNTSKPKKKKKKSDTPTTSTPAAAPTPTQTTPAPTTPTTPPADPCAQYVGNVGLLRPCCAQYPSTAKPASCSALNGKRATRELY